MDHILKQFLRNITLVYMDKKNLFDLEFLYQNKKEIVMTFISYYSLAQIKKRSFFQI